MSLSLTQKRKKVTRACLRCQKQHLHCDEDRPCKRCVDAQLSSECHDGPRKTAKYLLEPQESPIPFPAVIEEQQRPSISHFSTPQQIYTGVQNYHDYTVGFHGLMQFAKERMDRHDLLKICKALAQIRPSLISTVKPLVRADLILMERCFQRALLVTFEIN